MERTPDFSICKPLLGNADRARERAPSKTLGASAEARTTAAGTYRV